MKLKSLLVLLAAAAFAVSPFVNPEFGGFDPDRYPNPQKNTPVQPAGYAFAIWGIIYLWLLLHAVWGLWKRVDAAIWDATRAPLLLSLGVGVFWLPVALVSPVWATLMIWIMLAGALIAAHKARGGGPVWALQLPLGLYAGWLTAASFVSIGLLGAGYGIAFAETGWAVLALTGAVVFAIFQQLRLAGVWTYGLAAGWGFAAIAVANLGQISWLAGLAGVAALLVLALAAREALR